MLEQSREHSRQSRQTHDPQHPHCSIPDGEAGAALRANHSDAFECWMFDGMQGIGKTVVVELLLDLTGMNAHHRKTNYINTRHLTRCNTIGSDSMD